MTGKKLKIIAIVVVLLINVVFAFLIISDRNSEQRYSKSEIENLKIVLEDSNLEISEKFLTGKKVKMDSYSSKYTLEDIMNLVIRVYPDIVIRKTSDEISFTYAGGKWNITKESYVEFIAEGYEKEDYTVLNYSENEKTDFAKKLKQTILYDKVKRDKLNKNSIKLDIKVSDVKKTESNNYYVTFCQAVNGYMLDNVFVAVFKNDEVVYIKGDLFYAFPDDYHKSENTSLLDIIIEEKRRVKDNGETNVLKEIVYTYGIYYDGYSTNYFIPVCRFVYEDGTYSSYDYVTGESV